VLITKSDLLAVLDDFDPAEALRCLRQLASSAPMLNLSAKTGDGMHNWVNWVEEARA
jgi:hydrogenase nickel incorporation protein HypB